MFKFSQKFKNLDLFGEPITLHLNEQKKFKTTKGALLTLLMIGLVTLFSSNNISAIIYKNNVKVASQEEINTLAPTIDIKGRFAIYFQTSSSQNLNGRRYFNMYGLVGRYTLDQNGNYVRDKIFHTFKSCNSNDFPQFSLEELQKKDVKSWFCFNTSGSDQLEILGKFSNPIYQYVQISLTKCNNSTREINDQCAPDSEIKGIFEQKLYLRLAVVNSFLDLSNYETPIKYYFDDLLTVLSYENLFIQKEIYFTAINVKTDQSWLFKSDLFNWAQAKINQTDFVYENKQEEYTSNMQFTFQNDPLYVSLYLKSDPVKRVYSRSYTTFQDFLGNFGSYLSVFLIIFKSIANIIHNHELYEVIAESLYELSNMNSKFSIRGLVHSIKNFVTKNPFAKKSRSSIVKTVFNKGNNSNSKGPPPIRKIMENKIKNETDLIKILKNLSQIEIMKDLLLTPEQISLLQYRKKPKLSQNVNLPSFQSAFEKVFNLQEENEVNKKIVKGIDRKTLIEFKTKKRHLLDS